jgi:hypothetical protein
LNTYQTTFVIPNLNKEEAHVPICSVVLSSQRVDLKDALFNAQKEVFRQNQNMYLFAGYEQGVAAAQPLVAFVSFYHGQTKAFETQPMEMTSGLNN